MRAPGCFGEGLLGRGQAAVDAEHLPGHERRGVGDEEDRGTDRSVVVADAPEGMRLTMPALKSGSPSSVATWGVSTKVGMIALTRMPCLAHSVAHWRVSEAIAPLAAT
jgi:hypothetical protein